MSWFVKMYAPFFLNDTATTEIYTLSLHDALPILDHRGAPPRPRVARMVQSLPRPARQGEVRVRADAHRADARSEEHTSELQSPDHLVCRLLLEKKNIPVSTHLS